VAGKFSMDKRKGLNTIIIQASAKAKVNQRNPYYFISLGKVFFKMRKFEDDNQELKFWMQRLEENRIDPEKDE
jgi:hypothetical protein